MKDEVLALLEKFCKEGEQKPVIYKLAKELGKDVKEVTEVIKQLQAEGMVKYESTPSGDTYVCIQMSPKEILKLRIVNYLKENRRADIQTIARALAEDRSVVSNAVTELVNEGKVKFSGEAGASWVELA
ncbi:MAG: hypothetical protein H0Z19_00395 [Archaeoglobus sp.]|uniref:hypothetical protein n=1 Tax=Archaeoglobus sp. TaxID=1872626 RepID=UPI001D986AF1|nr:hypothetical protein [Archaeoglobus sp.]MBO8178935.1 hypothetical protein [Archaeoglobus sp.]